MAAAGSAASTGWCRSRSPRVDVPRLGVVQDDRGGRHRLHGLGRFVIAYPAGNTDFADTRV